MNSSDCCTLQHVVKFIDTLKFEENCMIINNIDIKRTLNDSVV